MSQNASVQPPATPRKRPTGRHVNQDDPQLLQAHARYITRLGEEITAQDNQK